MEVHWLLCLKVCWSMSLLHSSLNYSYIINNSHLRLRSLLLVLSGTPYTQQSYKVSESFPFKWINKKWKEGFHVTSMTTAGNRWGVVMSRNSGYSEQVKFDYVIWLLNVVWGSNVENMLIGCGAWFSLSEWRNTPEMGKWLQNNFNGCNCWSSSLYTKCT